jgi:hypothetical protein
VRDPGADCKLDERKQGNGSAQLVSPDRLVTAHHVISNAGLSLFTIRFDNSNPDGFWYADADYNKADEENPLLANRLWQIGLESWAINSNTHREVTRDFIREWKAVVDLDGYDSFNNPIDSQPFTSNFNIRRDISFIRVKELDNPNFTDAGDPASTPFHIKSGGFRLRYPGLFFNQVENDSIERKVGESKIIDLLNKANNSYTHLQLLSSPPWFDSSMAQNGGYAATACVSGFTDKASAPCAQHEFCLESNPVSSNYTACIKTTLDSVAGSSGGVMLMPTPLYSEVSDLYFFTESSRQSYGVLNGSTELATTSSWKDDTIVETENGMPKEHYTLITLGDINYKNWGARSFTFDTSNTPNFFTPIPNQPSSDGSPPCEPMPSGGCSYSFPVDNAVWGQPESEAPVASYPSITPAPADMPNTGASGQPPQRDKKTVRLQCNYGRYNGDVILNQNFRTKAGMAIGFVGTATDDYPDASTAVASLGVLCAPWSSASWSDNWYWILRHMRRRWEGNSDAAQSDVWQPVLRLALPFMYEWRRERETDERMLRPMSMKTCPPNYILHGVGVFHNSNKLVGLNKLICQNNRTEKLEVDLKPIQGPVGVNAWSYEIRDRLFTLDQRIGNPYSTASYDEITCPNEQIVAGVQITESSDGAVEHFHLECMPAPGNL